MLCLFLESLILPGYYTQDNLTQKAKKAAKSIPTYHSTTT